MWFVRIRLNIAKQCISLPSQTGKFLNAKLQSKIKSQSLEIIKLVSSDPVTLPHPLLLGPLSLASKTLYYLS